MLLILLSVSCVLAGPIYSETESNNNALPGPPEATERVDILGNNLHEFGHDVIWHEPGRDWSVGNPEVPTVKRPRLDGETIGSSESDDGNQEFGLEWMNDMDGLLLQDFASDLDFLYQTTPISVIEPTWIPFDSVGINSDKSNVFITVDAQAISTPTIESSELDKVRLKRNLITVGEAWQEYTRGLNGNPSIKSLEAEFGPKWRNNSAERKFFYGRRMIYEMVEELIRFRQDEDDAVAKVEELRVANKWSLNQLQNNLKIFKVNDGIIERKGDENDLISYTQYRNLTTVPQVWEEYTVGIYGQPSVRSLDLEFGSRWRTSFGARKIYESRKPIYSTVESLIHQGKTEQDAVNELETVRTRHGWSLSTLQLGISENEDWGQIPAYTLVRNLNTVKGIWTEYKVGINGSTSVQSLDSTYGANWRGTRRDRELYHRRQKVYFLVESLVSHGMSEEEAVAGLDKSLQESGKSLKWLEANGTTLVEEILTNRIGSLQPVNTNAQIENEALIFRSADFANDIHTTSYLNPVPTELPFDMHTASPVTPSSTATENEPATSHVKDSENNPHTTSNSLQSHATSSVTRNDTPTFHIIAIPKPTSISTLNKDPSTVGAVWQEYTRGLNGKPSIKALEAEFGAKWRSDDADRVLYYGRRQIYEMVEDLIRQKQTDDEAVAQVEALRKSNNWSIHTLQKNLKHFQAKNGRIEMIGSEPDNVPYTLLRNLTTVPQVWQEYTIGIYGNPSVRSLDIEYGSKWRTASPQDRIFNNRRTFIYNYIESSIQQGKPEQEAVNELETIRARHDWTLNTLQYYISQHDDWNQLPVYKQYRNLTTIKEIWAEYKVGINGNPSVQSLDSNYGSKWRANIVEQKYYSQRKKIYSLVENLVSHGLSDDEAVERLDKYLLGIQRKASWLGTQNQAEIVETILNPTESPLNAGN